MRYFFDGSKIKQAPDYTAPCADQAGPGYAYPGHPDSFDAVVGKTPSGQLMYETYHWTNPEHFVAAHGGGFSPAPPPGVGLGPVRGVFFPNSDNSGPFDLTSSAKPAFTRTFRVINFNPPADLQHCTNSIGVDERTRPFTSVVPNPNGPCATTVAEGNGQQAGVGDLEAFEAVFTAHLTVPRAGPVTFAVTADDGWILSIGPDGKGNQPTYVSGALMDPPKRGLATGFQVVGANNAISPVTQLMVTVDFPASGTYPIEVDYTECCSGELVLVLGTASATPIPPVR